MFERIGRLAERAANGVSVSRRGFLGRLGQGALSTAGVLGGLLALSNPAKAGGNTFYLCYYKPKGTRGCYTASGYTVGFCGGCPKPLNPCITPNGKKAIGTC